MTSNIGDHSGFRVVARAVNRDVRTPLHSVIGFLELLGISGLSEEQWDTFQYVLSETDTLSRAADRVLLLCQLVAGDQPCTHETFDLAELLGAAAAATDGEVRIIIDNQVPLELIGDVPSLRQLLEELLDNAAKHGSGMITLSAEPAGPISLDEAPVRISVTDQGTGISRAQLAFVNAPLPTIPTVGVGLYLVKHIIAWLGGNLSADRRSSRMSAELSLTPALTAGTPLILEAHMHDSDPDDTRLKILLVEDNEVNLTLAKRQMKLLGHILHTATRGRTGVNAALAEQFDVILMDRHLPDLDGVAATKEIRAAESKMGRYTPIFAVTADAMTRNRQECLAAGMDGFLTKPLDLEALRATLASVVRPGAPTPASELVVDRTILDQLAAHPGDRARIAELVHRYVTELPGRRLRLQHAIRNFAVDDILSRADTLCSDSVTVGAFRLAEHCRAIMAATRSGEVQNVLNLIPQLRAVCYLTTGTFIDIAHQVSNSVDVEV